MALTLTTDERTELERRTRSRRIRAEDARRAQVILMLANGHSFTTIAAALDCYPGYINLWRQRFQTERLPGLQAKYRGQPPVRTPTMEARILAKTRQRPPDGSSQWSTRKLAKVVGVTMYSSPARGGGPACNRIASSDTCCRPIRSSKRKPPTSSGST